MRIIAGKHRSRPILPPRDQQTTRPITDRIKESLFNRLHSLGVLGYGKVIDVFSGTGSMGLEALSRGAEHCTFVDMDRDVVARLKQNIDTLGETPNAHIVQGNALTLMWSASLRPGSLTIAFIDPPYKLMQETASRQAIDQLLQTLAPKMEEGGVLVLRTYRDIPADEVESLDGPVTFLEGTMSLHFYQRPLPAEEAEQEPEGTHKEQPSSSEEPNDQS